MQLHEIVADDNVLIPVDDDFKECQVRAATSCKAYVDDRALRPRFIDFLMHEVYTRLVRELDELKLECVLVVDAVGDTLRPAHAPRDAQMLCSAPEAYAVNLEALAQGEGDLKAEAHDRHIRMLLHDSPHELLSDVRVLMHSTVDTDAIAIFLASTATRARQACVELEPTEAYNGVITNECQSLIALEAVVGPRDEKRIEYFVCAPANLYSTFCKRMHVVGDPVAAETAVAALTTIWALAGCDFCAYRYGRLSLFTEELITYISSYGTEPFAGLLCHTTAKHASGALLAVWGRASTRYYALTTTAEDGKRRRGTAPSPTDDQLTHAIWASLYWRNAQPPDVDAELWGFYVSGVSSENAVQAMDEAVCCGE